MRITEITESINFYDRFGHDTGPQTRPYTVEVRDRETGGKKLISIQAVSAADARERARDRGYRVVRVVSQDEQGVSEAAGLYGPFTVTINTGERPHSRTKTKKFRREDDAILWAQDWLEDFSQYVFATAEVTDSEGNVVWTTDESLQEQDVREGQLDPYRLERLDPQSRRVLQRMADHAEPGSWLSASEAYAIMLGLQHKRQDPRGWEQEVQHYVDLWREITGKKS